jgi:hypothetical protein
MNTNSLDDPPRDEPQPEAALPVRLANVYAAPGELFESLRGQPPKLSNWLVPIILAAIVGVISVWVMYSQPAILQQVADAQAQQIQKSVDEGKMTQEQADKIQRDFGPMQATIIRIAGMIVAPIMVFAWLFIVSLVFFLMLRWVFHAPVPFMKTVEVVGLSQMIGVLGGLVTTLLMVITGSMFANAGPVLAISDFDVGNKLHLLASSVNLMTLWWLGVVSIGLARVSQVSFAKLALALFGIWAILRLLIVFSGLGSSGM